MKNNLYKSFGGIFISAKFSIVIETIIGQLRNLGIIVDYYGRVKDYNNSDDYYAIPPIDYDDESGKYWIICDFIRSSGEKLSDLIENSVNSLFKGEINQWTAEKMIYSDWKIEFNVTEFNNEDCASDGYLYNLRHVSGKPYNEIQIKRYKNDVCELTFDALTRLYEKQVRNIRYSFNESDTDEEVA